MQRWLMSGPEIQIQTFGNDLAAAKPHYPGIWRSFIRAVEHGSGLSQALGGHLSGRAIMS
jgi:hypothetical protein